MNLIMEKILKLRIKNKQTIKIFLTNCLTRKVCKFNKEIKQSMENIIILIQFTIINLNQ